jgi:hypothetical protein
MSLVFTNPICYNVYLTPEILFEPSVEQDDTEHKVVVFSMDRIVLSADKVS